MTIIATFKPQNVKVEILDVFECGGIKLAAVKAIEGKPFAGGDKWPVSTEFATVKAAELQPEAVNLLTLALAAGKNKSQWYSGESVWVFEPKRNQGAFLKECYGFVSLHLTGYSKSTPIFFLNGRNWIPARDVEKRYQAWASEASKAGAK
jgi:hypothetical protein